MSSRRLLVVAVALSVPLLAGCEKHRTKGTHTCEKKSDDYFNYWLKKPLDNAKVYASEEEATARILADGCTVYEVESDMVRACCASK